MRLARLRLANYRPFRALDMALPSSGLVLLIGANNAGKSALLSAFDVINEQVSSPAYAAAEGETAVEADFDLDEEDRRMVLEVAAHASAWIESSAFRSLHLRFELQEGAMVLTRVETSGLGDRRQALARVMSRDAGLISSQVVHAHWLRQVDPRDIPPHEDWPHGNSQSPADPQNLAPGPLDIGGQLWSGPLARWRNSYFHLPSFRAGTSRERELASAGDVDPSGENLPEALLEWRTGNARSWAELTSVVANVVPDVGELEVTTQGGHLQIAFRDPTSGFRLNVKDMGSGVEQSLLTGYIGVRGVPGATVVIEEPETNLHAAAQRQLLRFLHEWACRPPLHSVDALSDLPRPVEGSYHLARRTRQRFLDRPPDSRERVRCTRGCGRPCLGCPEP